MTARPEPLGIGSAETFFESVLWRKVETFKTRNLLYLTCLKRRRTGSIIRNLGRIVSEQDGFHIFHVVSVVL